MFNLQNGYTGVDTSPWLTSDTERFWDLSVGARWVPQARWTLTLDYLMAPTYDNTDTTTGGPQQAFPSELEQTGLRSFQSHLPMDACSADPFSLYA